MRLLKKVKIALVFATLVGVHTSAAAQPEAKASETSVEATGQLIDEGVAALISKDYKRASEIFGYLAQQGIAFDVYNFGLMYANGRGVRQDWVRATALYRMAAEEGVVEAQHDLGVAYLEGTGIPKDPVAAVTWFHMAAESGYAPSHYRLGVAYASGTGVAQDYKMAAFFYSLAANQRYREAQFMLSLLYAKGEGVPQSLVTALKWIDLSLAGVEPTSIDFEEARNLRDLIAKQMTPAQIAEAERLAGEWKKEQTP
ncbi:MAG: tetratricopeptide repeat protein [Alphaproteobacteria bacterium]|jgi:TPR repeat protein|nr:sel1 repeat family protein [Hyphomonadaceae bacterium]